MDIMTRLKQLLFITLLLIPVQVFAEDGNENVHSGSTINVEVDSGVDKNNLELLKKYELQQHIDNEIRRATKSNGELAFTVNDQVSVTVLEFHFRTGSFFAKGTEGKDFLRAKVEVAHMDAGVKKFTASASVTKGLTKRSRVKQLARELANQIALAVE